ncbi:MAG: hypothetical protein JNK85_02390 [Verrucomicrobiales bacterium]|nr:hypothetical protein [Verrucomicrobiales bacterium]
MPDSPDRSPAQIDADELARRLAVPDSDKPRLLDVREPEEHAFAAIPQSVLIPLGELPMRLDELEDWKPSEIVVYCHHGIRSMHAIAILRRAGFERLANLRGGIDRWSTDVDPSVPRY